jgi:CRP-like cAMP-binding protein
MPVQPELTEFRNRILASLDSEDLRLVAACLEPVRFSTRQYLETSGRRIDSVYFIEEGIASVVVVSRPSGRQAEVGLVGNDGMTGFALIHGIDRSPYNIFIQAAGHGYTMDVENVRSLMAARPGVYALFLRYGHVLNFQIGCAVLANATGSIEERLSRCLLMTHDRIQHDELKVTHEFFSVMLGVRRPGVTISLRRLETEGLIALRRGTTVILDRDGLVRRASGLYGAAEAESERLFGTWRRRHDQGPAAAI